MVLSDKKTSEEDLTKWDKEGKQKNKSKDSKVLTEEMEVDLDEMNQELSEEELAEKKVKPKSKKKN